MVAESDQRPSPGEEIGQNQADKEPLDAGFEGGFHAPVHNKQPFPHNAGRSLARAWPGQQVLFGRMSNFKRGRGGLQSKSSLLGDSAYRPIRSGDGGGQRRTAGAAMEALQHRLSAIEEGPHMQVDDLIACG